MLLFLLPLISVFGEQKAEVSRLKCKVHLAAWVRLDLLFSFQCRQHLNLGTFATSTCWIPVYIFRVLACVLSVLTADVYSVTVSIVIDGLPSVIGQKQVFLATVLLSVRMKFGRDPLLQGIHLWVHCHLSWCLRATDQTSKIKSAQRDTNLRAGTLQPDRTF